MLLYNVGVRDYYGDELTENKMGLPISVMRTMKNILIFKIFVCQHERKRTLEKPRLKLICNVKTELTKIGFEDVIEFVWLRTRSNGELWQRC